jgi:hypothetical protein
MKSEICMIGQLCIVSVTPARKATHAGVSAAIILSAFRSVHFPALGR